MRNMLLGLAVACLTVACASQTTAVEDAGAPGAECGVECEKACCEEASECSTGEASECSTEQKVCPVTGKPIS